jgi:hypothetical protein
VLFIIPLAITKAYAHSTESISCTVGGRCTDQPDSNLPFYLFAIFIGLSSLVTFVLWKNRAKLRRFPALNIYLPEPRTNVVFFIIGGLLIISASLYLSRFAIPMIDNCQRMPDSYYYCTEQMGSLQLIFLISMPIILGGIWLMLCGLQSRSLISLKHT